MITAPIFLVLHMHIRPIKLLKDGTLNVKFVVKEKLYIGSTSLNWDDSAKIKEIVAVDKDNKDEKKDF